MLPLLKRNPFNRAAIEDAFGRFRMQYSREQEIEADIVAYRFLEWCGIGGDVYIRMLKDYGKATGDYREGELDKTTYSELFHAINSGGSPSRKTRMMDSHPTTVSRIELLEYMAAGESKAMSVGNDKYTGTIK